MRLIITDLTEMQGGNYCVAGWDGQAQRMVRPLPNGNNWTAGLLQPNRIIPGATIDMMQNGREHHSVYPHKTEDTPIDPATIRHVDAGPINWFASTAPPTEATLAAVFRGSLLNNSIWDDVAQGVYIPVGSQIGSLGAIEIPRTRLRFVEEFNKLRAILDDGGARYKLAVSSLALKDSWRRGGVLGVLKVLPHSARLHIRLGLARALGNPPQKCYLMVNGVHG